MDPKTLTQSQLRALLEALANLPDKDLLFWDRRVQAARRRQAEARDADLGGEAWAGEPTRHTNRRGARTTDAGGPR